MRDREQIPHIGRGIPYLCGRPACHDSRVSDTVARRVVVHGSVQGVFFRESTRKAAESHDVGGWVRNNGDGTVEALFEGAPDAVDALVAFVHDGPNAARVDRVDVTDAAPEGHDGFAVR